MPILHPERATDLHRIVRLVRVVRGEMEFVLECEPRLDYGRASQEVEATDRGVIFRSDEQELSLRGTVPLELVGTDVRSSWRGTSEQVGGVVLESVVGELQRLEPSDVLEMFNATVRFWREWLGRSTYRGRWQEAVHRSAMTLKLMTYAPTGALVAAPTTSLPEQLGGERNWDYRFTWVRDGSFSVYALLGLGYTDEAAAFGRWLVDRASDRAGDAARPLKIMYRIDGSPDLQEEVLDHLEGYRGSSPVRIGNGASDQLQLDICSEAIDSVDLADRRGIVPAHHGWTHLARILDWLCDNWDRTDEGIWETRGGQRTSCTAA